MIFEREAVRVIRDARPQKDDDEQIKRNKELKKLKTKREKIKKMFHFSALFNLPWGRWKNLCTRQTIIEKIF